MAAHVESEAAANIGLVPLESSRLRRNGRSMKRHERIEHAKDTKRTAPVSKGFNSSIFRWFAKAKRQKCQRYREYEILPMNTNGGFDNMDLTMLPPFVPLQITNRAPKVGKSTAAPGNAVLFVYMNTEMAIKDTPVNATPFRTLLPRNSGKAPIANKLPSISSQARAGLK